uniref:Uncharacterized protein n=1 Tax=Plectus sambesii TaxID=2011161 RepID=A0A914XMI0_9BILA
MNHCGRWRRCNGDRHDRRAHERTQGGMARNVGTLMEMSLPNQQMRKAQMAGLPGHVAECRVVGRLRSAWTIDSPPPLSLPRPNANHGIYGVQTDSTVVVADRHLIHPNLLEAIRSLSPPSIVPKRNGIIADFNRSGTRFDSDGHDGALTNGLAVGIFAPPPTTDSTDILHHTIRPGPIHRS